MRHHLAVIASIFISPSAFAVESSLACSKGENLVSVPIFLEPKIIRITNKGDFDFCISMYKKSVGDSLGLGLLLIAQTTQIQHNLFLGNIIDVDDRSIAVEIAGHVYPQKVAKYLPDSVYKKVLSHTQVIDIGEKDVDDNRFVWDGLVFAYDAITGNSMRERALNPFEADIAEHMASDIKNGEMDPIVHDILDSKNK